MSSLAEFELRELIQERIRSGMALAKARGKRLGPTTRTTAKIGSACIASPGLDWGGLVISSDR